MSDPHEKEDKRIQDIPDNPVEQYWAMRMESCAQALEANNFEVHRVQTLAEAKTRVLQDILGRLEPESISWGGSMTFQASGLYEALKDNPDYRILDTYDKSLSPEESYERRRQALLTDLFFTGTNAMTETGKLVNLDMYGNRVGAIAFGPKNVVVLAGRNKITADLEEGLYRVKNFAAPVNTLRLKKKTPCVKTSYCADCSSKDRICNVWTFTEKSFPKGRIIVVLINQDLGF